jgi:hypothetical protein
VYSDVCTSKMQIVDNILSVFSLYNTDLLLKDSSHRCFENLDIKNTPRRCFYIFLPLNHCAVVSCGSKIRFLALN